MIALADLASGFQKVRWDSNRRGFVAPCNSHEDRSPSLHVSEGDDGKILFHCFAGCATEDILAKLGLKVSEVMPPKPGNGKPAHRIETGRREWPIYRRDGSLFAIHVRIDYDDGSKSMPWDPAGVSTVEAPLYRANAVKLGPAILCEGEKATDAAVRLGLNALGTVCGASATPSDESLSILHGRQVVFWPDADDAGQKHMAKIAERLVGKITSAKWIAIPNARAKADAADYRGTLAELRAFVSDRAVEEPSPFVAVVDRLKPALAELDRLHNGDWSRFVSTGVASLDRKMGGGLKRGEVALIGAPTGAGKTTLVVQFAMAASALGLAIIVSPEMSADALVTREIVRRSGYPKWDRAPWAPDALRDVAATAHCKAAADLLAHPPHVAIYDSLALSLDEITAAVKARAKKEPLSLVALDYAQQLADFEDQRRYLAVGQVALKALEIARECDCVCLVTSQVNTIRDGKTQRHTFRESQVLEQKAQNGLLFLVERDPDTKRITSAKFESTKLRDGAMFVLPVDYDARTFQISDAADAPQAELPHVRSWAQ